MSNLWFSRAQLKHDAQVQAIKSLLLPQPVEPHDQQPQTRDARHKLIWSLFADDPDRQRDFLWREDKAGTFFILSRRKPENPYFQFETKEWAPNLSSGDRLSFSLRVNPVIRRKTGETRRSRKGKTVPVWKKHDVVMDILRKYRPADPKTEDEGERCFERERLMQETGTSWLASQGMTHGLTPSDVTCARYYMARVPRPSHVKNPEKPMSFSVLDLGGELEVTQPELFCDKLIEGFGSSKAFGCGLMLIRRM